MIRNRFMPYFVRAAGLALLAATLTACGLLTDVSPPNLAVTVVETESGFLVRATARDGDSGIKSIEVASAVGEDVTTLHAEDFARAEEGEYPREVTVEVNVNRTGFGRGSSLLSCEWRASMKPRKPSSIQSRFLVDRAWPWRATRRPRMAYGLRVSKAMRYTEMPSPVWPGNAPLVYPRVTMEPSAITAMSSARS